MNAFVLEVLYAPGWTRESTLYWRRVDADIATRVAMSKDRARGVRILAVSIEPQAIAEIFAKPSLDDAAERSEVRRDE